MLRRIARKLRSAARAPLVPLRPALFQTKRLAQTSRVISRTLASAAMRSKAKLRVGVDILPFYEPLTGIGWYLYHLLSELARRDDLELVLFGAPMHSEEGPKLHVELPAGCRVATFDFRETPTSRFSNVMTKAAFPALAAAENCDVFFAANYVVPRILSPVVRKRVIVIHDLTYRRHPELLQQETLENLERGMLKEIVRADAIVCVSETTRRDVLEFYDVSPSRVHAVLSGLADDPVRSEEIAALPERYLLFVSTIEPRKNVKLLLDAFELLLESDGYDGDLVLVGKIGWKSEDVVRRLATSRWVHRIHHLDYLRREELEAVYEKAEIFVFPSIYEGFGFPLLEAMKHGVPSIASKASSLPEVGGDAALYVDPYDARELAASIRALAASPGLKSELAAKGRVRAERFKWSDTAERTAEILRQVARR